MLISNSETKERGLNFEINLIPVIDILSCCICFLLMTVVWVQIDTLDVNQSPSTITASGVTENAVWAKVSEDGDVHLEVHGVKKPTSFTISGLGGRLDVVNLEKKIKSIHQAYPTLKTALIVPSQKANYQEVIQTMDVLRGSQFKNLGMVPL